MKIFYVCSRHLIHLEHVCTSVMVNTVESIRERRNLTRLVKLSFFAKEVPVEMLYDT